MTFRPAGTKGVLVSEYETRVHDYQIYLDAMKREWDRKPAFEIKPTHPIMNVSWKDAMDFCAWLTERERASKLIPAGASFPSSHRCGMERRSRFAGRRRGDSPAAKNLRNTFDFPWGRDQWPPPVLSANPSMPPTCARLSRRLQQHCAPVGSFTPNTFQLYDIAGNVAEWCSDAWPGGAW